jgi:hypothetical protein
LRTASVASIEAGKPGVGADIRTPVALKAYHSARAGEDRSEPYVLDGDASLSFASTQASYSLLAGRKQGELPDFWMPSRRKYLSFQLVLKNPAGAGTGR